MFELLLNGVVGPETVHLGVMVVMAIMALSALVMLGLANPDFNAVRQQR